MYSSLLFTVPYGKSAAMVRLVLYRRKFALVSSSLSSYFFLSDSDFYHKQTPILHSASGCLCRTCLTSQMNDMSMVSICSDTQEIRNLSSLNLSPSFTEEPRPVKSQSLEKGVHKYRASLQILPPMFSPNGQDPPKPKIIKISDELASRKSWLDR